MTFLQNSLKKYIFTLIFYLKITMLDNPTSDDPEEKELYVSSVSSQ
jgi:hypothetical protein